MCMWGCARYPAVRGQHKLPSAIMWTLMQARLARPSPLWLQRRTRNLLRKKTPRQINRATGKENCPSTFCFCKSHYAQERFSAVLIWVRPPISGQFDLSLELSSTSRLSLVKVTHLSRRYTCTQCMQCVLCGGVRSVALWRGSILMHYVVMPYIGMTYVVMAYTVMASGVAAYSHMSMHSHRCRCVAAEPDRDQKAGSAGQAGRGSLQTRRQAGKRRAETCGSTGTRAASLRHLLTTAADHRHSINITYAWMIPWYTWARISLSCQGPCGRCASRERNTPCAYPPLSTNGEPGRPKPPQI